MNKRGYIGIDNGVTGSLAKILPQGGPSVVMPTPVLRQQDYTKKKKIIGRLDVEEFNCFLPYQSSSSVSYLAVLERPMINSTRFNASMSAIRCWEAILVCLEIAKISHIFVDSKKWQKEMLPQGLGKAKGPELKKASYDVSMRLFPQHSEFLKKQKDGDALLIAEWARRNNL